MSRSRRDQRGKRINGELFGRGEFAVTPNGKIIARVGGSEVGSQLRKRDAKRDATRMSRRVNKSIIRDGDHA